MPARASSCDSSHQQLAHIRGRSRERRLRGGQLPELVVDATSFALMRSLQISEALAFDGDFAAAGFVELRA
jgi:hypothetical protein